MNKVIYEFSVEKYKILQLDKKETPNAYKRYSINGKAYNIVPIYDAQNCIAVESNDSFIGKTVEYI